MRVYEATTDMAVLPLGRLGENETLQWVFDVSEWLEDYPGCTIGLVNQKPKSDDRYPCVISLPADGKVAWTITSAELTVVGRGSCELQCVIGGQVEKGKIWKTEVWDALDENADAPDPWETWETEFIRLKGLAEAAAEAAEESAEDAAESAEGAAAAVEKYPFIGTNGHWMVWNGATGAWEDTQIPAQGPTGATGPQGQAGVNGVVITTQPYQYAFYVNSSGHLILLYDGEDVPGFSIDENGHLIYTLTT